MVLDRLSAPIVLAPMAGGPSTPALASAVSEAGGLGFLASGYLKPNEVASAVATARELTAKPLGLNLFVPAMGPTDPAVYGAYVDRLREWAAERGLSVGEPRYTTDDFEAKVDLAVDSALEVVSFTFGAPEPGVVDRLQAAGCEVWVTVTSPAEAAQAVERGADALVVQGVEAGGHRGSFEDRDDLASHGLLPLLQLIRADSQIPLIAAGGIATRAGVAAVLAAGARAAQIGTAFMLCPEAGTTETHREALRSNAGTALTRAFTGRLARGIRNEFMRAHDTAAPIAYPEIHYATAPLRKSARERGDGSLVNLWAGEAYGLTQEAPAGELVGRLTPAVAG